jgi:hypothetical protein
MKKEVLEKTIEELLRKKVESLDGMCLKLYSISHSGLPDRIVIMPRNKFYLVETKRIYRNKITEPSGIQKWVHKQLAKKHVKVWIVNDHDSLDHFITHISKEQK